MSRLTKDITHDLTRTILMVQACEREAERSAVFVLLMHNAPPTAGEDMASEENHGRGSLKPLFDEAVEKLTAAFGADTPPADPVDAVWRAFPRLDLEHRTQLADELMKARA